MICYWKCIVIWRDPIGRSDFKIFYMEEEKDDSNSILTTDIDKVDVLKNRQKVWEIELNNQMSA